MSGTAEPVGTIDVALGHATRLLRKNPAMAARQAGEILKVYPGHPHARLVLGAAERLAGRPRAALQVLEALAREQPESAAVHLELGTALGEAGRCVDSIAALRRAVHFSPRSPDGWRLLADQFDALGDAAAAERARAHYLEAANRDPRLLEAAAALVDNDLPLADARLRAHLAAHPTDVAAMRMLAEVAARLRRYVDAQQLLERCLELAPSFAAARHNLAQVLNRQSKAAAALPHVERLLAGEPRHPGYRNLQAAVLAQLGDYAASIGVYESVLAEFPRQPKVWMSYGHALKTAGRAAGSIAAYRRAIALEPTLGEAYWSLANLKTFEFSDADMAALRALSTRAELTADDRLHVEFALGKALEDRAAYEASFAHYARGNALRRAAHPYSAADHTNFVRRSMTQMTPEFFAARAGGGAAARDPIFIVGLPRAGSTLLEQILASHSAVEGTMELPHIAQIAGELAADPSGYHAALARLTADERRALGARYLEETRRQRRTGAPLFVDKMPNNCLYLDLIALILPNAVVIDARRHPLGCGFSVFKQHFARGQNFSYSLDDIGCYYRDYVALLAHVDTVLPGRVHRVFYEALIEDTDAQVRRLLAHCGLPFEPGCLKFYDNERAVRTASSEQVRRPIFREGMEHWRHYAPWLDPLRQALGPVLDTYPVPPPADTAGPMKTNGRITT